MFKLTTRQITLAGVLGALMIVMGLIGGFVPVPNLSGAMTLYHIPIIIGAIICGPVVGLLLGVIFATIVTMQFWGMFPPYVLIPARLLIGPFAWLAYQGIKKLFGREDTIKPVWAYLIGGVVIAGILVVGFTTFNMTPPAELSVDKSHQLFNLYQSIKSMIASLSTNGIMFTIALAFAFGVPSILSLLKMKKVSTATSVSAVAGTLTNTVFTLGLGVVFPTILGETMKDRLIVATGIAATNGVIELILAVVLCMAIVPPLLDRFGLKDTQQAW